MESDSPQALLQPCSEQVYMGYWAGSFFDTYSVMYSSPRHGSCG